MATKAPSTKDDKPPAEAPADGADAQSLPPVESLDKDSDFTPFLADGVPEDLARAALRKLWHSDPEFAVLDGLNDYDEDYTIVKEIVSAVAEVLSGKEGEAGSGQPPGEIPEQGAPEDGAPEEGDLVQPAGKTSQLIAASMESDKENSDLEKAKNGNEPGEPDLS